MNNMEMGRDSDVKDVRVLRFKGMAVAEMGNGISYDRGRDIWPLHLHAVRLGDRKVRENGRRIVSATGYIRRYEYKGSDSRSEITEVIT